MRVYNLTDVKTLALETSGLLNQTIVVGTELVAPGGSVEVEDTGHRRNQLQHLMKVGALALDQLPAWYVAGKAQAPVQERVSLKIIPEKPQEPVPEVVVAPEEPKRKGRG